mgnify:FL=1
MEIIIFIISIFLLSSINFSIQYLSKYKNLKFDKNGHMGSSLVWKNHSKFAGLVIFFGDSVLKGFFPIFISKYILNFNYEYMFLLIITVQLIGNNWSIFLNFKGGRGMAISIGSLLGINLFLAIILYSIYIFLYFFKFKDGGITWIISLIITAAISLTFSLSLFYCYIACLLITILKRITGNNLNFDISIILNRIIYDRDVKYSD